MTRRGGIEFKLTPKARDVHIHCSAIGAEIVTPGGIQDRITSQRTIYILKKVQQQVILGTGYRHFLVATCNFPAADIDRHIREPKYLLDDIARSAGHNGVSTAGQLVYAGRFPLVTDYYIIHVHDAPLLWLSATLRLDPL
jgi:hypothetical protein